METLEQFYDFMREVHTVRRAVTSYYLAQAHTPHHMRSLEKALSALDGLPGGTLDKKLAAGGHETTVTLDYERGELEKDIFFLGHDDEEFAEFLASRHDSAQDQDAGTPCFSEEVDATVAFLRRLRVANFITDRDGTVNNYCGRYRSSHQSIWNAVYLTRFVRAATDQPVILTSAPLGSDGLLELTAMPSGSTHYAGSKGREYHSRTGDRGAMEIDRAQADALDELNRRIEKLVTHPEYRVFGSIGSGVQQKFGQTTVARQDIHHSIPDELSEEFLEQVRETVRKTDPDGSTFGIEDTGKDIEILLTVEGQREFTKGDGIAYLDSALELDIASGPNLICGDTSSDVPMVEKAVELSGGNSTATIFVTDDESLRESVRGAAGTHHFVSTPDVLVVALQRIALERA